MPPSSQSPGETLSRDQLIAGLRYLRGIGFTHLPTAIGGAAAAVLPETATPRLIPAESTPQHLNESTSQRLNESTNESTDLFGGPVAGEVSPKGPPLSRADRLARLDARAQELASCERCKLCPAQNHVANRLVYGVGNPEAHIVFVGEGPGEDEDRLGEPFVGRGGALLTKIVKAMGLEREEVYICNVVKHRPPGNRDPERDEIDACEPFLIEQLDVIRPKVLVTLGNCATKTLLRTKVGITKLRGTWMTYHGVPVMPTYHPAYLLRSYTETNRKAVWSDMKQVLEKLKDAAGKS